MKKKIDMTYKYRMANTHNNADSFKRRMKDYGAKVVAEKKARDKADRVRK